MNRMPDNLLSLPGVLRLRERLAAFQSSLVHLSSTK